MRRSPLRAIALGATLLFGPLVALGPGCGSDANGVDSCRQIESARCALAPQCSTFATKQSQTSGLPVVKTSTDVTHCQEFYRDQCLNGLQNTTVNVTQDQANGCIAALAAAAACAAAPTLEGCKGAETATDAGAAEAPCSVLLIHPQDLAACAFVAAPPDAGTPAMNDSDASDASDGPTE